MILIENLIMHTLRSFWKLMKRSYSQQNDKSVNASSETEFSSSNQRISVFSDIFIGSRTSFESECSSEGSRTSIFSMKKIKYSDTEVEVYNPQGLTPLELDQSLNMRAYRMSMYRLG